jgi:hypothetical protein
VTNALSPEAGWGAWTVSQGRPESYTTVVTHPDGIKEITQYRSAPGNVVLDQDVRAYLSAEWAVGQGRGTATGARRPPPGTPYR